MTKIKVYIFNVIITIVFTQFLIAQENSTVPIGTQLGRDGVTIFNDAAKIFTAPYHYGNDEWLTTGIVLLGTAIIIAADNPAQDLLTEHHTNIEDRLASFGREYGREIYGLGLAGGLYTCGLISKKPEIRKTGLMLFESIAFAGTVSTVAKFFFGRSRPYNGEGPYRFRGFQFKPQRTSMPSGHSTIAFAVSSVLSERFDNIYISIGLYSCATITAFSRVYHNQHWMSDTFLGAVIGTSCGIAVAHLHGEDKEKISLRIIPTIDGIQAVYYLN